MAPWLLGLLIVSSVLIAVFPLLPDWSSALIDYSSSHMSFLVEGGTFTKVLSWTILIFLFLFLVGAGFILFYCLYILLCAPFYSLLVESVLKQQGKLPQKSFSFPHWLGLTLKMFSVSLVKALIFGLIALFGFFLSFVPGLNLIVPVLAALIFAFDSMDYSFETLGYGLRQRFSYFSRNKDQLLLMSLSMGLTLLLPGLTFLALPGAVVGAALLIQTEGDV